MASCNFCGKEAGYLHSVCDSCRAAMPPRPEKQVNSSAPIRNPLRIDPNDRASSSSKTKLVVGSVAALVIVVLFSAMFGDTSSDSKTELAKALIHRQIASDISIDIDNSSLHLHDHGGIFFYVCGSAMLNSPGGSEISLNNVTQRFITTVNRSSQSGFTLFDGSHSLDGLANFQEQWITRCG